MGRGLLIEGCDASDDNVVLEKLFHSNLKLLLVTEGSNGCGALAVKSERSRSCFAHRSRSSPYVAQSSFSGGD